MNTGCYILRYAHKRNGSVDRFLAAFEQEAEAVELNTKSQSKSPLWFSMRTGRITASHFKAASRTSPVSPSISLIMSICHPEISRFKTAAMCLGCEHKQGQVCKCASMSHHNFKVEESGLFISTEYPFVGAFPDGLVTCACCSDGVREIKLCSLTLILCIHTYSNHMTIYPMCSAILSQRRYHWKGCWRHQLLLSKKRWRVLSETWLLLSGLYDNILLMNTQN